jgi:hypothetical protein
MSKQWMDMKEKPREFRAIWNPSSSCPQGQLGTNYYYYCKVVVDDEMFLELWVDILTPAEAALSPPVDIQPPSRQVIKTSQLLSLLLKCFN